MALCSYKVVGGTDVIRTMTALVAIVRSRFVKSHGEDMFGTTFVQAQTVARANCLEVILSKHMNSIRDRRQRCLLRRVSQTTLQFH